MMKEDDLTPAFACTLGVYVCDGPFVDWASAECPGIGDLCEASAVADGCSACLSIGFVILWTAAGRFAIRVFVA